MFIVFSAALFMSSYTPGSGFKSSFFEVSRFTLILLSPVMHTDCTNARENGKSCYVYVCATPDGKALYFARRKKGHELIFIFTQ